MDAITSSPCLVESQSFIYIPCPTDAKPGNGKYQVYVFITLAYSGNLGYFGGGEVGNRRCFHVECLVIVYFRRGLD